MASWWAFTIYPDESIVRIEDESTIAEDDFAKMWVSFNNHTETHIDYHSHFFANGLKNSNFNNQEIFDLEILLLDISSDTLAS